MINYGTGKEKLNHIGLFTDVTSESKARSLIGKRLYDSYYLLKFIQNWNAIPHC
jgi:hypothetical protein